MKITRRQDIEDLSTFTGICEYQDGTKQWLVAGTIHRIDGPAVELPGGSKFWFMNGDRHRLDGPACEFSDGSTRWLVNGKLHRLDGPAIEWPDGRKYWYINDNQYSEEKFNRHSLVMQYKQKLSVETEE
jgi:hypothetical protein